MKDGGTAFPVYAHEGAVDPGMSLRDYFAGQALVGLAARGERNVMYVAQYAYEYADAMLAEREKEENK